MREVTGGGGCTVTTTTDRPYINLTLMMSGLGISHSDTPGQAPAQGIYMKVPGAVNVDDGLGSSDTV